MSDIGSDFSALNIWINEKLNDGPIAIVTHKNGDMDTIGSALVLSEIIGPSARACGLHMGKIAQKISDQTGSNFNKMNVNNQLWPRTLSGIIVVDCASWSQTGLELPVDIPICAIDHHQGGSDWSEADLVINWTVSSTAEMIWQLHKQLSPEALSENSAKLLLAGLITDTGRFKHADVNSFKAAGEILQSSGLDYGLFLESLESNQLNISQKKAISKAMSRLEIEDAGDWFLLHTKGSTNEGVIAHALLACGADVSVVARRAKEETRLIGRATKNAVSEGVHVGEIMASLRETLGGEGGGHAGAAGWSGSVPSITAISAFISALSSIRRVKN